MGLVPLGSMAGNDDDDARMEARMEAEQEEARLERYPEGLILVDSMAFVRNYSGPHEFGPEELSLKLALEYNIKARVVAQGGLVFPALGARAEVSGRARVGYVRCRCGEAGVRRCGFRRQQRVWYSGQQGAV